jgi:enolase
VSDLRIKDVLAWEALDSRGTPTVGCEVTLAAGNTGEAIVPSGASVGSHEAFELRDGEERYGGLGVARAVGHVGKELRSAVIGIEATDQRRVDAALRAADGTPNLSRLGANAVLAVSVAAALAAASGTGQPLYRQAASADEVVLPLPMVNILSGGSHAGGLLDFQDFLAVPVGAQTFSQAIEWVWRVRRSAAALLAERGFVSALVADEGGVAAALETNRQALEVLTRAISDASLRPGDDVAIAIDVAATQLRDNTSYRLETERRTIGAAELIDELLEWVEHYPIVSIEDPLAEDDWSGWEAASKILGGIQIVGDDLFATNLERLERGISLGVANAVLVKPNQTGTLSDARQVTSRANESGYASILSARSGETEDAWLADLAVAWGVGQIKVGSTTRSERNAKWNRLLRIESDAKGHARFAGRSALAGKSELRSG